MKLILHYYTDSYYGHPETVAFEAPSKNEAKKTLLKLIKRVKQNPDWYKQYILRTVSFYGGQLVIDNWPSMDEEKDRKDNYSVCNFTIETLEEYFETCRLPKIEGATV